MSNETEKRTAVATPTDRTIRIERVFDAPRDRVWEAITDPQLIPKWWGQPETETIVDKLEFRVGGDWRFVQRNESGDENGFRGTYREISPPERIVQTFEWEGMPGHVVVETMELEALGEQTKLTNVSLFHTSEERDGMLSAGMESGLSASYRQLDQLLAGWEDR